MLIGIFLFITIGIFALRSYNKEGDDKFMKEWTQVEKYEKENLPKSALEVVDKILVKSISNKNTTEAIKALLYKSRVKSYIDNDTNIEIFANLENLLTSTTNKADKALINSILAELYSLYYDTDSWTIDQRTDLFDFVPKDMKEWSANIFKDKIRSHLNASIENPEDLINTSTESYKDIINEGTDSNRIYPSLYDFLMNRAIDQSLKLDRQNNINQVLKKNNISSSDLALPTQDFIKLNFGDNNELLTLSYFSQYLKSLTDRNLDEAIVFTELKRNGYLENESDTYASKYSTPFLEDLAKKYENKDYCVEIINSILSNLGYNSVVIGYDTDPKQAKIIYDRLNTAIQKYPNYNRINILKSKLEQLVQPKATIEGSDIFYPTKNKIFTLKYKNIKELKIKVIDKKSKKTVWSHDFKLSPKASYVTEEFDFNIDLNQIGQYEVIPTFDKKTVTNQDYQNFDFRISELAYFSRTIGENKFEFYVVNRQTSTPVSDATITIYSALWNSGKDKDEYTKITEVKTDSKGFCTYDLDAVVKANSKNNKRFVYTVSYGKDDVSDYNRLSGYYSSRNNDSFSKDDRISIFTDRSIYRPGQTVYFKAVVTQQIDPQNYVVVPNKEYQVELYDANYQVVSKKNLKSNEFGSFAGEFILPQDGLTGEFRIKIGNSSEYISVEEYKRPTFQITFDKIDKAYTFGDKVVVVGHAENFSGIKLQDAKVEYSVVKSPYFRWWSQGSTETIDEGTVVTKNDGSFEITFTIPKNDSKNYFGQNIFRYEITAFITDSNGETQTESQTLTVGDISLILSTNIKEKIDKNSIDNITIMAKNLNGQDIKTNGTYTIYTVLENDSIDKKVSTGQFSTGEVPSLKKQFEELTSSKYLIEFKAKDDKGRDVSTKNYFILYSADDKRPPIKTNNWIIEKRTTFSMSENAEIVIGVSSNNVTILYELMKGSKVYECQQFVLSDENKTISTPYKDEYGDNINILLTYVVDEKLYQNQINIKKKEEDTSLKLKWDVFRDKVRPGQKEEWRITVNEHDGKPAIAELLASMYDSSLDKLRQTNPWSFNFRTSNYAYPVPFTAESFGNIYCHVGFVSKIRSISSPNLKWDELNLFGFTFDEGSKREYVYYTAPVVTASAPPPPLLKGKSSGVEISVASVEGSDDAYAVDIAELKEHKVIVSEESTDRDTDGGVNEPKSAVQIRKNFNETAFFYPQLQTNEKGETVLSFTVPESNTTWKFRALAYDKSLNVGQLEALVISRKELMVIPNIPRFVRQGDMTSISTKISNLSEKAISGKVRMEFYNPLTDKAENIKIENQYQNFSLDKEASSSVTWIFDVPSNIDMLGVRIIAENESFSDGEQHVVPVLPNRMLVTESMTMNLNGEQTKDFVFDHLVNNKSKSLTNYRLTFEYASNPAWYAIQALPSIDIPTSDNIVEWFASYYVNILGTSIVKQYPKVTAMIEAWKKQGGNKEILVSNLQKNQELKAVLLEETPWVLDAKNETEQMERLSLLFDINSNDQKSQKAINKLKDFQREDGGWSWYKDMQSSRSITLFVLYGFNQLVNLNAVEYPSDVKEMQIKALKYIDDQIISDYNKLQKADKDWKKRTFISTSQLEYLYVRSSYRDIPISQSAREAERFYTSVVEKNWTSLSLYEQSLLVVLSKRNGNKELANKIIKALREHAITNDEMGMFWANNLGDVFISQSAVCSHTFIMEAFKEMDAPTAEMDLMKQWLLKQKQTQNWGSSCATVNAIYALLSTGNDWFASSDDSKIKINHKLVEVENKKLGTGFIQKSWFGNEISNNMGKVQIQKLDNGPAWGAMYWQYYENLDKIKAQTGELNIDKKLFIEQNGALSQITEIRPIKVGDKITVRLTVRVDRDMEFVQLKDMRAACFEPIDVISGMRWQNGTYYYQSTKDASTNFSFDRLVKGTYVFEYSVYANRAGQYSNGITTIQCMYAPEFISQTEGIRVTVK